MQTEKVVSFNTDNEVQCRTGVIESMDEDVYQIVHLATSYFAKRSFSCMVEPVPGDVVMFSIDAGRQNYILSILERADNKQTRMAFSGDVILDVKQGQLQLNAEQDININTVGNINQVSEEYTVLSKKALFGIDHVSAVGSKLVSKINQVHTIADTVEMVAGNLLHKLKNSFRSIQGVDQSQAKDVIHTVENLYSLRSKQSAILAKKDIKVDAERIHMG